MDGYCLRGEFDKASVVLETMRSKEILPNTLSYNILINGYCKKLKVDRAVDLFQQMSYEGLTQSIGTYSTILQGFFHTGRPVEAQFFLKEKLLKPGLKLDKVTCHILLHGFCQNPYVVEALSLFDIMECRLIDEANELFVEMESSGCLLNDVTYNTLIRGCFHHKKYNEAGVLIDKMCARGFSADASTASVLLDLLESQEQDPALLALLKKFLPQE
ncbi:pentatricopeptide repeat-containing protein, mitochondrial-like [Heracleum sosnowskyi]|uniref:Pentatricopeptide repeat-containing protein, mitochondrial-like n=1 Tax=Heracleum sosnowskyi TaxID=360622 RepID=A0AAD8GRG6_9APIA|nr:pentatricopeptide repeat-containing protein, mitochondrial-like [Heracleum sosnowskyi]